MKRHFISQKYSVIFDDYAERCYIKDFSKKHKGHWGPTRQSINDALERIANLSNTSHLDVICVSNKDTIIAKYDFKIAKTNVSAKSSGNRCIVEVCNEKLEVRVLLVYSKNHIDRPDKQETLWWKEHIVSCANLCCI